MSPTDATDRAAWGRLCRLLTLGNRRAEKGDCHLDLPDLLQWGEGLMLGIKCKVPNTSLQAAAVAEKLLTIGAGDNVVRLLPPLVITRAEVDEALHKLDRACKAVTPAAA